MSETAPALSSTPQVSSVSKVRLSLATTDSGGLATVCVPVVSSTSTVLPGPSALAWLASEPGEPQPARVRAKTPARALSCRRDETIGNLLPAIFGLEKHVHTLAISLA